MTSVNITLPDGNKREVAAGTPGDKFAGEIAKSLAKKAVAMKVDGKLVDLSTSLDNDVEVEFITRDDDEALELIRHDLAHVMAQAVTELFDDANPTIGPVIKDGFYYDFHVAEPFTESDLEKIEKRMREIVDEKIPLTREVWDRNEAKKFFTKEDEPFKVELIDMIPEGEEVSFYRQGKFVDLCRGPHMPTTKHAGKAFKLTSVAGSYWRGDSDREQLQRIYGTAWRNEKDLTNHLTLIEEAKRRDHRKLGQAMKLFHLQEEAAGSVFWHPHGWTVVKLLKDYMQYRQEHGGYAEINTPQIIDRSLWESSGHWAKFRDNMYLVENETGITDFAKDINETPIFGLKPMNCPGHVMIYRQGTKSYRDLPLRFAEFGSCHRCEPKGALHGIMRVRAFTQDDGHIFCAPEQIVEETSLFLSLLDQIYKDLGFADYKIKYADRPEVRSGSDEVWDNAEKALIEACKLCNVDYEINEGEGAFYGPKLEFVLTDALGREWQCGTFQVDFVLPENLEAFYTDKSGNKQRPVMLHRAILGSIERFVGILLEHTDGHLPLWLSPIQAMVTTVVSDVDPYAKQLEQRLQKAGIRTDIDIRNEKISYKVREHSVAKIPIICVLGEREMKEKTVTLRRLGSNKTTTMSQDEFVEQILNESKPPHHQ